MGEQQTVRKRTPNICIEEYINLREATNQETTY
jgi:hypothetical protein